MILPRHILFAALPALISTGPASADFLRAANAAAHAGDFATAERLYAVAAERTADPGLVAFNLATVLFAQDRFREAEMHFALAFDDEDAPTERRAKAAYNRGVCLLKRPGEIAAVRAAIACFETTLDTAADDALLADARHNLEVAKLLRGRLHDKTEAPPPGDRGPEPTAPKSESPPPESMAGSDGGRTTALPAKGGLVPAPATTPTGSADATAGRGTLPVLIDAEAMQKLSPADARAHLSRIADRLARDRRTHDRLKAGPDRPHVRDW